MSSIKVPNTGATISDGTIVMLARFPGVRWIVHDGWYTYNGQQYSGWYFSSIPANTVLPMNNQDLATLTVVSGTGSETGPDIPGYWPPAPIPPYPPVPPCPPSPQPYPPVPPIPPTPTPGGDAEVFTVKLKAQLEAAFISVPTLKQRDNLDTEDMPDGKIVRVNNVNGEPKYYEWSKYSEEWIETNLGSGDSYSKEEVDSKLSELSNSVQTGFDSAAEAINAVDDKYEDIITAQQAKIDVLNQQNEQLVEEYNRIQTRIEEISDSIYHIEKLTELLSENTVLVSNDGAIADSGMSIGDGSIDETAETADEKTLATEKAVARKVEESALKWESF